MSLEAIDLAERLESLGYHAQAEPIRKAAEQKGMPQSLAIEEIRRTVEGLTKRFGSEVPFIRRLRIGLKAYELVKNFDDVFEQDVKITEGGLLTVSGSSLYEEGEIGPLYEIGVIVQDAGRWDQLRRQVYGRIWQPNIFAVEILVDPFAGDERFGRVTVPPTYKDKSGRRVIVDHNVGQSYREFPQERVYGLVVTLLDSLAKSGKF